MVVADEETDPTAWREAAALALDCGAHVVPTTAGEHDAAVARISHLPHILAAVLAATGADGGPLALSLAAGSFARRHAGGGHAGGAGAGDVRGEPACRCWTRWTTRWAGWARRAARWRRPAGWRRPCGRATQRGRSWWRCGRAGREEVRIDLTDPEAFDDLRSLGAGGGRVLRLEGDMAIADLPG